MNEDEVLDRVVALWKEADDLEDTADKLESEATNYHKMAEDKDDQAEGLWKPLIASHPEWVDALRAGEDPPMTTVRITDLADTTEEVVKHLRKTADFIEALSDGATVTVSGEMNVEVRYPEKITESEARALDGNR